MLASEIVKRFAVFMLVLVGLGVAYVVAGSYVTLGNAGTVRGVGVYWDSGCTLQVVSVDGGLTGPGAVENVTVYVRNEGGAPVTLSLQTANWNPVDASNCVCLSWDYDGHWVGVDEVVEVVLSVSIASNVAGIEEFSFDAVISSVG